MHVWIFTIRLHAVFQVFVAKTIAELLFLKGGINVSLFFSLTPYFINILYYFDGVYEEKKMVLRSFFFLF